MDISSLNLVGAQADLVRSVIAANPKTIVVFQSGKPVTEPWISNSTAALVQQFYPSEQGGNALADVLFGAYNPSGRLSVSIPQDVGTTPSYHDFLKGGRLVGDFGHVSADGSLSFGHQYVLASGYPLYPFGFGRSYSTFSFSHVAVDQTNTTADAIVNVSVTVKNTGKVDGTEVVQVYVTDAIASVVVPNIELKGFKKVVLKAGETKTVSIPIDVSTLGVWTTRSQYVVEPGQFIVKVGPDSANFPLTTSFWVS